jgi:hypothetical protein
VAFLNWRFGLTQMTLWRIEVAPFPGLSYVATPTKAIITIPTTLYGYGNGDDAEEGGSRLSAMGGNMGEKRHAPAASSCSVSLTTRTGSSSSLYRSVSSRSPGDERGPRVFARSALSTLF